MRDVLMAITAAAAACLFHVSPAQAAITLTSNGTGLTNPSTTLNFTEAGLADGTVVTDQYTSFGAEFTNLFQYVGPFYLGSPSLASFDFDSCPCLVPEIVFTSAVTAAAFQAYANSGQALFEIFLGNTLVGSFGATVGPNQNYHLISGGAFDRIRVTAPHNNAVIFDNLQIGNASVGAVPEPGTWAMMLLGFGAVGFAMRHGRRQRVPPELALAE